MILYHGSNQNFDNVDLSKAKDRRDFGKGFYTTTIREQALQWGYNMFNRFDGEGIFLYEFDFSPYGSLKSKQFSRISDEWFDFILSNRISNVLQHDFDFVQGPVANDKTVLTITGFIDGLFTREEAMRRLRYSKTNDQVSLHTERAVSLLKLRDKRKSSFDKIMYNGQELTFLIVQKTEHIVSIIAEKEKSSFDSVYANFLSSKIYKSLQIPVSLLWAENAEFIADEYIREKADVKNELQNNRR
jgi:predicted ester cyclase